MVRLDNVSIHIFFTFYTQNRLLWIIPLILFWLVPIAYSDSPSANLFVRSTEMVSIQILIAFISIHLVKFYNLNHLFIPIIYIILTLLLRYLPEEVVTYIFPIFVIPGVIVGIFLNPLLWIKNFCTNL